MSNTTHLSPQDIVSGLDWRRLTAQRWFRQKSAATGRIEFVDGWPVYRTSVLHGWWLIIRASTETESIDYQLPVVLTANPPSTSEILGTYQRSADTLSIADGASDPTLLASLLSGATPQLVSGTVDVRSWCGTPPAFDDITVVSADSTNSLVRLGTKYLLKVYRVIDAGGMRETEMLEVLANAKVKSAPSLKACVEYRVDTERHALALVQEWIDDAEDVWTWLIHLLAAGPCNVADDIVAMADAVCEVHLGLRSLGARPWNNTDTDDLKRRIFAGIAHAEHSVENVTIHRDTLRQTRELVTTVDVPKSGYLHAVHGDLHLGQLLRQSSPHQVRYRVIDFEGEPLAHPEERNAWHSPLKDVAGMLRSFDYAAGFARQAGAPGSDAEWNTWLQTCEQAFLDRYWIHASVSGVDSVEMNRLLAHAIVEKALYEIAYEAATRPDWIDIPVRGLSRALDRLRASCHE